MGSKVLIKRLNVLGAVLVICIAIIASVLLSGFSFAQEQNPSNAITISISPQLLEVTANPGEVIKNTFKLTNSSTENLVVKAVPKNFTPAGEEGAVNLTEDDTTYSIAKWITVSPSTATVPASKSQNFEVIIDVPPDVEPGSHFGSVVFQTVPPEDDSAAALISQEIAPVILVKVAGDVTETAEIEEFISTNTIYSNEPTIQFISRIKNTGTAHFKPTGQIVIKNMFGNEIAKLDIKKENVLPDSIRQITTDWAHDKYLVGRYTAELTVISDDGNQIRTETTSFTVFPYQTILPILFGLLLIGFIFYKGRKRIKLAAQALSGKDSEK